MSACYYVTISLLGLAKLLKILQLASGFEILEIEKCQKILKLEKARSCTPRGWSGAGVEMVCWRVLGIPLLENKKDVWCLGFLVFCFLISKFIGFLVSWFHSFLVSKFPRFNDPRLPHSHFMLFYRYWSHIRYFEAFIERIFGISGGRLFDNGQTWISNNLRFITNNVLKRVRFLLALLSILVSPISNSKNTRPKWTGMILRSF